MKKPQLGTYELTNPWPAVAVGLSLILLLGLGPAPAMSGFGSTVEKPDAVTYDGTKSWVVNVQDGGMSDLRTWANSSDNREIISSYDGWAVVATPHDQARSGLIDLLDTPLESRAWVEGISPNYQHSGAQDVQNLKSNSSYSPEGFSISEKAFRRFDVPSPPSGQGIAFTGDANRTTMAEVRDYIGVDNVSVSADNVTVAVIDTGINVANGTVFGDGTAGSAIRVDQDSKNFVNNSTVYADGYGAVADGNGHGTWVASSIAANHSNATHDGMAPDASLLVLKGLADDGSGSSAQIAAAVRYAVDHDADVISMSLGSPVWDPALTDALQYAEQNGVPVVVAAGNSRLSPAPWVASPADADPAITVAATNGEPAAEAESAYFSQVGPDPGTTDDSGGKSEGALPDVAAPGMSTVAKTPSESGTVRTTALSGTSMATPEVAGAIALYLGQHPDSTPSEVRKWVRESARPLPKAAVTEVGAGYLAAGRLVDEEVAAVDQQDAMTSTSSSRDRYYRTLSETEGGWLQSLLQSLPN